MPLKDKYAVITGCNKGIGKETVKVFSESGINVFACVRKIDQSFKKYTKDLEKKFKNKIIPIELDLSDKDLVKSAANKILGKKKDIHILVNNAGAIETSLFQMSSMKNFYNLFDVNYFNQTLFTQYILKSLIKSKNGSIVYVSSTAALDGNVGRNIYSSSKAAINAQAKVLARELGRLNIRVNVVAPGLVDTEMMRENTPEKISDKVISESSLNRLGNPLEIANTILFLSSDKSSFITGQVIRVDGGM
jgi:3-oxoacyl-[acyl-carrier protein] reductase